MKRFSTVKEATNFMKPLLTGLTIGILITLVGVSVYTSYIAPTILNFTYREEAYHKPQLECKNLTIRTSSQKLVNYEILNITSTITLQNPFREKRNFTFRVADYGIVEHPIAEEMKKKPFAIYYSMLERTYGDSPELFFSPAIHINPTEQTYYNIDPFQVFNFTTRINFIDDREEIAKKDWYFSVNIPYTLMSYKGELEEFRDFSACKGIIKVVFEGREPEYYLGDFISESSPFQSPWGDSMYKVEDLPKYGGIHNITLSKKEKEIVINIQTYQGGICGIFNRTYCFDYEIKLEEESLILRDKPSGEIIRNISQKFISPITLKNDGNVYTLRVPMLGEYGNWYQEIWYRGKVIYRNEYYGEEYEAQEPFVLFIGAGRLWYFR